MLGSSYFAALVMEWDVEYVWLSLSWLACRLLSCGWMKVEYWKRLEI